MENDNVMLQEYLIHLLDGTIIRCCEDYETPNDKSILPCMLIPAKNILPCSDRMPLMGRHCAAVTLIARICRSRWNASA